MGGNGKQKPVPAEVGTRAWNASYHIPLLIMRPINRCSFMHNWVCSK